MCVRPGACAAFFVPNSSTTAGSKTRVSAYPVARAKRNAGRRLAARCTERSLRAAIVGTHLGALCLAGSGAAKGRGSGVGGCGIGPRCATCGTSRHSVATTVVGVRESEPDAQINRAAGVGRGIRVGGVGSGRLAAAPAPNGMDPLAPGRAATGNRGLARCWLSARRIVFSHIGAFAAEERRFRTAGLRTISPATWH